MGYEIIYIIGLIASIISVFLGIWLIGITKRDLRKISVFLTLIAVFLVLDGLSLTFHDITGSATSSNTFLGIIADLRPLTPINQVQYTAISFFLMITLFNIKRIIKKA